MIIDTISLILITLSILLTIISVMFNPFFRKIGIDETKIDKQDDIIMPKLTVLITALENPERLKEHLPAILNQNYPSGFEIVVVGQKGNMQMEELSQGIEGKNIYSTYIPKHSLFMSKSKLAVALGVKASHNEWLVLINENCQPQSDLWLQSMAKHMHGFNNLVLGYSNYNEKAKSYYRFDRLRTSCYLMRKISNNVAFRAGGPNIAFRRSDFISKDGYRGNLQYTNGEYDFLVNKFSVNGKTEIAVEKDARIIEDTPSHKNWIDRNICYMHIRKFLKRSMAMHITYNIDMILMHLNYISLLVTIGISLYTSRWIALAVSIFCLVLTYILRCLLAKRAYSRFGENLSTILTPLYELSIIWHTLFYMIKYAMSDKYDFTTHKL